MTNKKSFFTLFFAFLYLACPSYAQIKVSSWLLEENIQFSKKTWDETQQNETITRFNLGQGVGKFFHKKWLVGLSINYQKTTTKSERVLLTALPIYGMPQPTRYKIEEQTLMPFVYVKFYHQILEKLYISGRLSGGYGITKNDLTIEGAISSNQSVDATSSNRIDLTSELLFFPFKRVGLQVNFNGFNLHNYKKTTFGNPPTKYTDFDFDISPMNWTFGAIILLN